MIQADFPNKTTCWIVWTESKQQGWVQTWELKTVQRLKPKQKRLELQCLKVCVVVQQDDLMQNTNCQRNRSSPLCFFTSHHKDHTESSVAVLQGRRFHIDRWRRWILHQDGCWSQISWQGMKHHKHLGKLVSLWLHRSNFLLLCWMFW